MEKKTRFEVNERFDPVACRHYLNDVCTVLHSHHYAALCTQLADDAEDFNGIRHLTRAAEDTFYELLKSYFIRHAADSLEAKIAIVEQYWETMGMGQIRFKSAGKYVVHAEMEYSHVDQGWSEKWGKRDKPVNFITQGFVAAAVSLLTDKPPRSFTVREVRSLICGDEVSVFKAILE